MYFANTTALWALIALAIPIIIHLFNFRRFKKIYFSNVSLLREIKIDTQSTNRLKHLLILATRLLTILFIVLAFAQPFLKKDNSSAKQGSSAISIFVDNSFSMNAENKNGTLLDGAKKAAREIALGYKPSDKFQLLTQDFEGRHQRFYSREEFLDLLDNVQLTASSKNINQINARQADLFSNANQNNKSAYIISDLQQSKFQLKRAKIDTNFTTKLVSIIANETTNIYIDSVWFSSPIHQNNSTEILNVKVKSSGSENQQFDNVPIKLYINNEQKALASFSTETSTSTIIQLSFTNKSVGIQECRIELQDHPITYDDNFYFSYRVSDKVNITCINGNSENQFLNNLFTKDIYCNYSNVLSNSIDYSSLTRSNFIIINELNSISTGLAQELIKLIKNGCSVLVIPAKGIDISSYNNFFSNTSAAEFVKWDTTKTKVEHINIEHILFNDIFEKDKLRKNNLDLPFILSHYTIQQKAKANVEPLLQLQDGSNFLYSSKHGGGMLYVSNTPFASANTNFVKHALFVPIIYKMAITSISQKELYHTFGNNEIIKINASLGSSDVLYHLINKAKKIDVILANKKGLNETKLLVHNQIKESANYQITNNNNIVDIASFNYDNKESELMYYTPSEIEAEIEDNNLTTVSVLTNSGKSLTQQIKEANVGKPLWKLCLWLSLIFLLIEVTLLSPLINNLIKHRAINKK